MLVGFFNQSCRLAHSPEPLVDPNAEDAWSHMSYTTVWAVVRAWGAAFATGSGYMDRSTFLLADVMPPFAPQIWKASGPARYFINSTPAALSVMRTATSPPTMAAFEGPAGPGRGKNVN